MGQKATAGVIITIGLGGDVLVEATMGCKRGLTSAHVSKLYEVGDRVPIELRRIMAVVDMGEDPLESGISAWADSTGLHLPRRVEGVGQMFRVGDTNKVYNLFAVALEDLPYDIAAELAAANPNQGGN